MKTNRMRQTCLLAVALASGGAGALVEYGAASVAVSGPSSGALNVLDFGPNGPGAILLENGDGTALTLATVFLSPTNVLSSLSFANTDFTIATDVPPGQSGMGTGSGMGEFAMTGLFAFDFISGMLEGPFDVSVEMAVSDAPEISAFVQQGVFTVSNPLTGETAVFRRNTHGSQATGNTAGSLSIYVDDGSGAPGLIVDVTGIFGLVGENRVNTVQQIH